MSRKKADLSDLTASGKSGSKRAFFCGLALGASFLILLGSLLFMNNARTRMKEETFRRDEMLEKAEELTFSLPARLAGVPGFPDRFGDVMENNTEELTEILRRSPNETEAEFSAGEEYEKLAAALWQLGDYERAEAAEEEAVTLFRGLADRREPRADRALAAAWNNLGSIRHAAGHFQLAEQAYEDAVRLYRGSGAGRDLTLARMLFNAGVNYAALGREEKAAEKYLQCLEIFSALPSDDETVLAAARAEASYGLLLYRQKELAGAEEMLRASHELYGKIPQPAEAQHKQEDLTVMGSLASLLRDAGNHAEADSLFGVALAGWDMLWAQTENPDFARRAVALLEERGVCLALMGEADAAESCGKETVERSEELWNWTGEPQDRILFARSLCLYAWKCFRTGHLEESEECFRRGLREYENVSAELSRDQQASFRAFMALNILFHQRNVRGALDSARSACVLSPGDFLANRALAYACLYGGLEIEAESILQKVIELGKTEKELVRLDLEAQRAAGLSSAFRDDFLDDLK